MGTSNKNSYPDKGTAKRAAQGSIVTFIGQVIRSLEHIILIPLFLWAWGEAMYGEWMTIFSLIAYLSISDLGINQYVTNRMTQSFAKGDIKEYLKSFKSAFGLYSIITGILFIVLLIFAFTAPLFEWFDFSSSPENQVRVSLLILGSYMILGTISSLVSGLYTSSGDYVRGRIVSIARRVFLIGFIVLSLFLGASFISVATWYLLLLLAMTLFILWDVKRNHPEVKFNKGDLDWELAKSFLVPGGFFLLIPLSQMIQIQGSVLIVSSFIGSIAVASFTIHRTLSNFIQRIVSIVKQPLFPEITVDEERKNYAKLQTVHNMFLKTALFLATAAPVWLYFTGGGILRIWTGGEIMLDHDLWIALLIGVPVYTIWHFSSSFLVATNNYKKYSIMRIISAVLGVGLALTFVDIWGVVGVVVGFLLSDVVINLWWVPKETTKLIKGKFLDFLKIFVVGLVLAVALFLIGWPIDAYLNNPWLKFILIGLAVFGFGSLFTYFIWLNNNERKIVKRFLNKFFNKIKNT